MRVDVYGPGEVTGIDRRLILRTDPRPGATDFEPNYLVAIEFDPPDFPWLFTPAAHRAVSCGPWCVLVVVEKGPGVTVCGPRRRAAAGAHDRRACASVAGSCPTSPSRGRGRTRRSWRRRAAAAPDLETDPDGNLSRLICPGGSGPRPATSPAVVPAFDLGVARGLGQPVTADQTQASRRGSSPTRRSTPTASHCRSTTSGSSRRRSRTTSSRWRAACTDPSARRRTSAGAGSSPPPGTRTSPSRRSRPPPATITMEGALRPAEANATPLPVQAPQLTTRLAGIVARRDTSRELPAPLYGEWPAAQHTSRTRPLVLRAEHTVAHRIAAALGTEVVRRNQEAFVQAAWEQVGQVREANELAQRARLAAAVLDRIVATALRPTSGRPPRAARRADPAGHLGRRRPPTAHRCGRSPPTSRDGSVPTGAASPAYRRLASGQRQAVKLAVRKAGLSRRDGVLALTADDPALVEPDPGPPDGVTTLRDLSKLRPTGSSERVRLAPLGLQGETTRRRSRSSCRLRTRRPAPHRKPPVLPAVRAGRRGQPGDGTRREDGTRHPSDLPPTAAGHGHDGARRSSTRR